MTGALQYPRRYSARGYCSREREAEDRWLGLQGELGTPAAGLRPRPAREKVFPSNLLLDSIDTSPLLI
jgi:hypothetical protein